MAFVIDKETVAPGVILVRRGDVAHRNWYCRVKLPKADRYKTFSLKTEKITEARELASDHASEIKWALKNDHPVFDRPFLAVAREYLAVQEERAARHEISAGRVQKMRSVIDQPFLMTGKRASMAHQIW